VEHQVVRWPQRQEALPRHVVEEHVVVVQERQTERVREAQREEQREQQQADHPLGG
jgi:hypothetical protein